MFAGWPCLWSFPANVSERSLCVSPLVVKANLWASDTPFAWAIFVCVAGGVHFLWPSMASCSCRCSFGSQARHAGTNHPAMHAVMQFCFGITPGIALHGCVYMKEGFVVGSVATYQQLQRNVGFACGRVDSLCAYWPPMSCGTHKFQSSREYLPNWVELYICCMWSTMSV